LPLLFAQPLRSLPLRLYDFSFQFADLPGKKEARYSIRQSVSILSATGFRSASGMEKYFQTAGKFQKKKYLF